MPPSNLRSLRDFASKTIVRNCASTTRTMPRRAARKIARLPKLGATQASSGASRIRQSTENTPP